jgi:hypothetical protein
VTPHWTLMLAGVPASGGGLLAAAGAGKLYSGLRRHATDGAIRGALGLAPGTWLLVQLTAGVLECATGALVFAGVVPLVAAVAMTGEGAAFLGLLAYARKTGAPGDCGCFGRGRAANGHVGWRAFARAAWVLACGLLEFAAPWPRPGTLTRPWPATGAFVGTVAVMALSISLPPRTPRCHRSLWRPLRHTLCRLTAHPVFGGIAATVPLGAEFAHRRAGCADEFWFLIAGERENPHRAAFFRVTEHRANGLVVYARLREDLPQAPRLRMHPLERNGLHSENALRSTRDHSQHVHGRRARLEESRK